MCKKYNITAKLISFCTLNKTSLRTAFCKHSWANIIRYYTYAEIRTKLRENCTPVITDCSRARDLLNFSVSVTKTLLIILALRIVSTALL